MKHFIFGFIAVALAMVAVFVSPLAAALIGLAVAVVVSMTLHRPGMVTRARVLFMALFALVLAPVAAMAQTEGGGDVGGWLAIFEALPGWLVAITSVVTAATAITALTPTKTDDAIVNAILRVLNGLT